MVELQTGCRENGLATLFIFESHTLNRILTFVGLIKRCIMVGNILATLIQVKFCVCGKCFRNAKGFGQARRRERLNHEGRQEHVALCVMHIAYWSLRKTWTHWLKSRNRYVMLRQETELSPMENFLHMQRWQQIKWRRQRMIGVVDWCTRIYMLTPE